MSPLRTVAATRYVTPLREGGSLPAIVEADDEGLYVLKFRGAGQGPKALAAEVVAGELARGLGQNGHEVAIFGKHVADGEPGKHAPQLREFFYPGFQAGIARGSASNRRSSS